VRPVTFRWHRWEYPEGTARLGLTCDRCDSPGSPHVDPLNLSEEAHLEASKAHKCYPGPYHWDDWRRTAFDRGMDAETASAGRALIREHYQHGWEGELDTDGMMELGLQSPDKARARWDRSLDRGARTEQAGRRPMLRGRG
jgi:hypothetical protein